MCTVVQRGKGQLRVNYMGNDVQLHNSFPWLQKDKPPSTGSKYCKRLIDCKKPKILS
jgi:hypothetical protein